MGDSEGGTNTATGAGAWQVPLQGSQGGRRRCACLLQGAAQRARQGPPPLLRERAHALSLRGGVQRRQVEPREALQRLCRARRRVGRGLQEKRARHAARVPAKKILWL